METIKELEDTRKVWRMVNGVLLEKTKGEIVPEVNTEISNMDNVCDQISNALQQKKQEISRLEQQ